LAELRVEGWSSPTGAAAAVEGVFVEFVSLLVFAQRAQVDSEVGGGVEGVGVVVAEGAAASVEGVFVQFASLLVLAQLAQVDGEVVGLGEGAGVVVAKGAAAPVERPGHGAPPRRRR
jgi:hypothetical protein